MKIKSLSDLKKIRDELQEEVELRTSAKSNSTETEILIGMATCGISSGAKETFEAFAKKIQQENLPNIKLTPVGCIGFCHLEPIVQVNMPGKSSVLYGRVHKDEVQEIVSRHIKEGSPLERLKINYEFERG